MSVQSEGKAEEKYCVFHSRKLTNKVWHW